MPNLNKLGLIFLAVVIVLALTPTAGWSQNVYGTIAGTVTDTSGAVVGDASVSLTNLDTGETRKISTRRVGQL